MGAPSCHQLAGWMFLVGPTLDCSFGPVCSVLPLRVCSLFGCVCLFRFGKKKKKFPFNLNTNSIGVLYELGVFRSYFINFTITVYIYEKIVTIVVYWSVYKILNIGVFITVYEFIGV